MPQTIAESLRQVMKAQGVDTLELSKRLGYSDRAMVDHWLAGRRAVSHRNVVRLAHALGVQPTAIDPAGAAYTPSKRKARAAEKRQSAETVVPPSHSPVAAPPLSPEGVVMGSGEPALFEQVEGAWKMLRNDDERRAFIEHVRGFVHLSTAPEAARKKAAG